MVNTALLSPNSVLSFLAKQEGRCEVLVSENTRNKSGVVDVLEEVVTMNIGNKPPDDTKAKPGEYKTGNEPKEYIAPSHVNHGGENILKIYLISNELSIIDKPASVFYSCD